MKGKLPIGIVALAVVTALLAAHGSSVRAQPVASIDLPDPGSTVALYAGCNNIALSFADATASDTVVDAVTPAGVVEAMWRHDAAERRWEGFSPAAPAASDLKTVNAWDAVWLCIAGAPAPAPTATAPPPPAPTATPPPEPQAGCDIPCAATGCTCADFSTGADAQWFYDNCSPVNPDSLDSDRDGRACEALQGCDQFPCWSSEILPCSCGKISTQAEAQWFYDTCEPNGWLFLDTDRDGVACEALP